MKGDELERMLDDALASYAAVEPRGGLEARVVARVRADGRRSRRWWMAPIFAAAGLTCLIAAAALWRSEVPAPRVVEVARSGSAPREAPDPVKEVQVEGSGEAAGEVVRHARVAPPSRRARARSSLRATSQERMLMALAKDAPETIQRLASRDEPLEIQPIVIRQLAVEDLKGGENQ